MLQKIDIDVIYKKMDWKDAEVQSRLQSARKYEILIPNRIETDYIVNL